MAQSPQDHVHFRCPRCRELLEANVAAPCTVVKCPTCATDVPVPPPVQVVGKPTPSAVGQEAVKNDEYSLHPEAEAPRPDASERVFGVLSTPSLEETALSRRLPGEAAESDEEESGEEAGERPPAWQVAGESSLRRLFLIGTFGFLLYPGVLARLLSLVVIPIPAIIASVCAVSWSGVEGVMGRLLAVAVSFVFGGLWLICASQYGLAILRDSAYGSDEVQWPGLLAMESIGDLVFLFMAAFFAVLPGWVVAALGSWSGNARWVAVGVSVCLLFPVTLLSMLEANSAAQPISIPVWRSMVRQRRAWSLFYLLTLAPGGIIAVLLAVLIRSSGWWSGVIVGTVALSAAWMVYFRLLGRLTWQCSNLQDADNLPPDGTSATRWDPTENR